MIDAARRAGKTLMVAHALRYWPEYRLTHDLYRRGELGDGGWFSARRLTGVLYATQGAQGWRADPARAGGAALDLQIHDLDFVCWLFGPPQAVFAHGLRLPGGGRGVGPQAGGPGGGWEHLATTLRYADGRGATVESSFILPPGDPFEISFRLLSGPYSLTYRYSPPDFALHGLHGEEERPGAAGGPSEPGAAEGGPAPSLLLYRDGQDSRVLARAEVDSFPAAIAAEIADFARCLRAGEAPACDGGAARLALAVALASLQSCETGQAVELPELLA
jgi:UDP-N-acetylglucosamine 3-dehydrogenase